jgi:two-component system, OmpR family, sensor kinase
VRAALARLAGASLRIRVLVAATVLVTVTLAVMGVLGTALLRGYLLDRVDAQLKGFAAIASRTPDRGRAGRPYPASTPQHRGSAQLPTDFFLEIVDPDGAVHVTPGSLHETSPPALSAAQLHRSAGPFTAAARNDPGHSWRVVVRAMTGGRHAVIAFSLDGEQSTVGQLETADAVAGIVAVVLLAGIGFPLVKASLKPLGRIEDTAAAIAAGDLSRRIDAPREHTEVGRLATALNTMLGRIESAYRAREEGEARALDSEARALDSEARALDSEDRMRRFVADASHELRTPLTSVKGLAEFYLQLGGTAAPEEVRRLVSGIQAEAARMGRLVDDLLLLARFDEDRRLEAQPVDLASVAAEAVQTARTVQPGRPVHVTAAPKPVVVTADPARLRQIIDNLVNNALQHTPAGTPVTVTVEAGAGQGTLTVADAGPGLSAEQASRVFERFYRTDRARSRASGGTGLGLSIVAALVTAHNGTICVDTAPGRGAAFIVKLPLTASQGTPKPDTRKFAGHLNGPGSQAR